MFCTFTVWVIVESVDDNLSINLTTFLDPFMLMPLIIENHQGRDLVWVFHAHIDALHLIGVELQAPFLPVVNLCACTDTSSMVLREVKPAGNNASQHVHGIPTGKNIA